MTAAKQLWLKPRRPKLVDALLQCYVKNLENILLSMLCKECTLNYKWLWVKVAGVI